MKTKLALTVAFQTDGDYSIGELTERLFEKFHVGNTPCIKQYEVKGDPYEFEFHLECEGDDSECTGTAQLLLECLMCSIRARPSNYWLVKEIYQFLEYPHDSQLYRKIEAYYEDEIGGNYEGTKITIDLHPV